MMYENYENTFETPLFICSFMLSNRGQDVGGRGLFIQPSIQWSVPLRLSRCVGRGILENMQTRKSFLENTAHRIRFIYTPRHASWPVCTVPRGSMHAFTDRRSPWRLGWGFAPARCGGRVVYVPTERTLRAMVFEPTKVRRRLRGLR